MTFEQLSKQDLYEMMQLRVDVFVVEQNCAYAEFDGKDILADVHHLFGKQDGELVAYARLLPAGVSFDEISIGRVAVKKSARGKALGHDLIKQAITSCQTLWPTESIQIGAQEHLTFFYQQYGFRPVSEPYLEDGILHINMLRSH